MSLQYFMPIAITMNTNLISAVMQTPTPHAITTITVSTSGQQDGK